MKVNKKFAIIFCTFFIVFLMISSTTVVANVNSSPLMKQLDKREQIKGFCDGNEGLFLFFKELSYKKIVDVSSNCLKSVNKDIESARYFIATILLGISFCCLLLIILCLLVVIGYPMFFLLAVLFVVLGLPLLMIFGIFSPFLLIIYFIFKSLFDKIFEILRSIIETIWDIICTIGAFLAYFLMPLYVSWIVFKSEGKISFFEAFEDFFQWVQSLFPSV